MLGSDEEMNDEAAPMAGFVGVPGALVLPLVVEAVSPTSLPGVLADRELEELVAVVLEPAAAEVEAAPAAADLLAALAVSFGSFSGLSGFSIFSILIFTVELRPKLAPLVPAPKLALLAIELFRPSFSEEKDKEAVLDGADEDDAAADADDEDADDVDDDDADDVDDDDNGEAPTVAAGDRVEEAPTFAGVVEDGVLVVGPL